jgi:uncharacterized secreted protein with C-terminal beta-propeller domain
MVDWTRDQLRSKVTAWGLDGGYWHGGPGIDFMVEDSASTGAVPSAGREESSTSTNTQEAGVDEGDVVDHDGRFLYSVLGGRLRSVELASAEVVSDVELPSGSHQLIVHADRLVVVTQVFTQAASVEVQVFSLVDGSVELLSHHVVEGRLVAVRSVAGTARVVVAHDLTTRLEFAYPRDGSRRGTQESLEFNTSVVDSVDVDVIVPRISTVGSDNTFSEPVPAMSCAQVGRPGQFSGLGTTWVATVDLASGSVAGDTAVIADAQAVYATEADLFVATTRHPDRSERSDELIGPGPGRRDSRLLPQTAIHRFTAASAGAPMRYTASGSVPGRVVNQYALSFGDGLVKVATTVEASGFATRKESQIAILRPAGSKLDVVGRVGGMGIDEDIQSVRFAGRYAYVVTFRQIDPFYVVDLSDPTAPVVLGELKIPGFSTYLHPVSDTLVVGVGVDADDAGRTSGAQLSLFDVSDPSAPSRTDTEALGWHSEALEDPHAFAFYPARDLVVVPSSGSSCMMDGCWSGEEQSAHVALVEVKNGRLVRVGTVDGAARRAMVVDDELVLVSDEGVRVVDLDTVEVVRQVRF